MIKSAIYSSLNASKLYSSSSIASISTVATSNYSIHQIGEKINNDFVIKTKDSYRLEITKGGKRISPWHDIPLYPEESSSKHGPHTLIVNYVNEIPRGSTAKMEIATKEPFNPIKQDVKKGVLRHYPFESLVNYGALPQTWENPKHKDSRTGLLGDNDPVDVCEVGTRVALTGEVYKVKIIGALGMIDEGEMDYKLLGIAKDDPLAHSIHSVADLERFMPGKIQKIVNWFKWYKVPDGKPVNSFAFEDKAKDVDFAIEIVKEMHNHWKNKENIKGSKLWVE